MRINPYAANNIPAYGVGQNNKKVSTPNEKTGVQEQTTTDIAAKIDINDVVGSAAPSTSTTKFEYSSIAEYKAALKISDNPTEEELSRRAAYRDSLRGVEIKPQERAINPERLAEDKAKAAKYAPIQAKMLSGQTLTAEEKAFLRESYPAAYNNAVQMESEVTNLRNQLGGAQSKEDAQRIYTEALMRNISTDKNNFNPGMTAALEKVYRSL